MKKLEKNILITGGSRGLGKAMTEALARAGARIAIVGRNGDNIEQTASEFRDMGLDVSAIQGNLGSKEDIYRISSLAFEALGTIDILINNAATLGTETLQLLLDTDCEALEDALQTNLLGPFRLSKAVAGPMLLNGGGTIVNISSDAAVQAYPEWGAYSVSKAALEHLTRIMAVESAPARINFLIVDPGEMNTLLHAQALPDADPDSLSDPDLIAEAFREFLLNTSQENTLQHVAYNRQLDKMEAL